MDAASSVRPGRWQRPPVMIVGAHRSGTTATARALELLGLQLGQRLDSHLESKPLQRLHEDYLHRVGAAWHSPKSFIEWNKADQERDCLEYLSRNVRQNFARIFGYRKNPRGLWLLAGLKLGAPWGWKEPRTTLFSPLWLQIFPKARVIDVIRHPLAVAMSIRRRELEFRAAGDSPTPQLDDPDYCLRLALTYVQFGEQLAAYTPYYRRVRFEDIQADPSGVLKNLAEFCDLRSSPAQLARAAASIRPENPRQWVDLPKDAARLLSRHPMVEKLGYGLPDQT